MHQFTVTEPVPNSATRTVGWFRFVCSRFSKSQLQLKLTCCMCGGKLAYFGYHYTRHIHTHRHKADVSSSWSNTWCYGPLVPSQYVVRNIIQIIVCKCKCLKICTSFFSLNILSFASVIDSNSNHLQNCTYLQLDGTQHTHGIQSFVACVFLKNHGHP